MLDVKIIRENPDLVKKMVKNRGLDLDIDALVKIDEERRKLTLELEQLKYKKNTLSEEIAKMMAGQNSGAHDLISDAKALSQKIAEIKPKVDEIEQKVTNLLLNVPNMCHESVPVGMGEKHNKIVRSWGRQPKFNFNPRTHLELSEDLGL